MVIVASQAASELLCLHTQERSKRLIEINSEKRVKKKRKKKRDGKKGWKKSAKKGSNNNNNTVTMRSSTPWAPEVSAMDQPMFSKRLEKTN